MAAYTMPTLSSNESSSSQTKNNDSEINAVPQGMSLKKRKSLAIDCNNGNKPLLEPLSGATGESECFSTNSVPASWQ